LLSRFAPTELSVSEFTSYEPSAPRFSEYDSALAGGASKPGGTAMSSRKLDELAGDVDDATTIVHELQDDDDSDRDEKLDELDKTLEHASDTIEDLDNTDDE
jgi:hypothetical protein